MANQDRLWTSEFIAIACINLLMFISFHMLIATIPFYIKSLGGDEALAGMAAGLFAIASVVARPASGWLLDHRSRVFVALASLIALVVLPSLYPLAQTLILVLLIRVIHGAVWSLSSTAISTLACDIIPQQRFGEGMGIFGTGSAVSMALGPILGLSLLNNGGYNLLFGIAAGFAVLSVGLLLGNQKKIRQLSLATNMPPADRPGLFDKMAWPASVTMLLFLIPYGAISTFIALYAMEIDIANGGLFFSLMAITTILMRIIAGRTLDRVGEKPIVISSTISQLLSLALLAWWPEAGGFILSALLFGIGFGMMSPTMQALAVMNTPSHRRGAASSTYLCAFDCGIGLGGVIAGVLLKYCNYSQTFAAMLLFTILSYIVYCIWQRRMGN